MKLFSAIVGLMIIVHLSMVVIKFFNLMAVEGHETEHVFLIIHSLILLELFYITITYFYLDIIEPGMIVLVVLTALGREIIVTDIFNPEISYLKFLSVGVIFFLSILGLRILPCTIFKVKKIK